MLKNITIKKICYGTMLLFLCFLFILFPNEDVVNLDDKESIIYTSNTLTHDIFLINKDNYVSMTNVAVSDNDVINMSKTLIEYLIIDGKKEDNIPNGFRGIIPSNTEINSIELDGSILKIDFNSYFLDIDKEHENKMIESIIYTLTTIDEVKGIIISVDGKVLDKLPKSNIKLPSILDRNYGINKSYDLDSIYDINMTTVYYLSKNNDLYYYVPVTYVNNSNLDKIDIIVEELSSTNISNNLISYMDSNSKLIDYSISGGVMYLNISNIFDSNLSISDEVLNTINLSIKDNYNINEVVFMNNDVEVIKSVIRVN